MEFPENQPLYPLLPALEMIFVVQTGRLRGQSTPSHSFKGFLDDFFVSPLRSANLKSTPLTF